MIVVRAKKGVVFINEKKCTCIEHNIKKKSVVWVSDTHTCNAHDVESIKLVSDDEKYEYKSESSEVIELKQKLEEVKNFKDNLRRAYMYVCDREYEYMQFVNDIKKIIDSDDLTLAGYKEMTKRHIDVLTKNIERITERCYKPEEEKA